jgi:ATP-binding cassette subfamily B multidrug efflux pump
LMVRFGHIIRVRFDRIQEMFSSMSAAVQQTIAGVRLVRAFVQEKTELRRFEKINQSYVRANGELALYSSALDPLLTFAIGVSVLIVLFYGGSRVISSKLEVGNFVLFTTYVAALIRPISSLGRVVNLMQRGSASVGRLQALFQQQPQIVSGSGAISAVRTKAVQREIGFHRVSVHYGNVTALDSFDIQVPAGSTIALLGRTGSGKSTVARLLPRLIDPTKGRLTIDGIDGRDLPLSTLRSMIGLVPQETFLFSATLSENIAFGVPQAGPDEIRRVAEIAGLSGDIESFPAGFNTLVGERGIMLSGGQKQRIAIARAILLNPRILVLDDALSSVDSVTEGRILHQLRSIMDERTTFLITHRVATAQSADHIVVLDAGRIVERGGHRELLALRGHYSRMHDLQVLEEELGIL